MDFRLLGPMDVLDGDATVPVAAGKQRALLAILLLNANKTVPRDRLVDDLWGDEAPESALKMVQIHVSHLRKALPEPRLQTRAPGYVIEVGSDELDLARFERSVAAGREALSRGDAGTAADLLEQGLELWRGPALAEFTEPFAGHESARLEELRAAAIEWRIEAQLALGRHGDVVGELDTLVARHPLRERLRSQQMLALYRSGRHAEALDAYQSFRRMLDEDLGIDPPAALKELERRILQQDPSLDAPSQQTLAQARAGGDGSAAPVLGAVVEPPAGRGRELAHLDRLLAEAHGGQRRLVFVTGEAAIGKTTIVESFLTWALGGEKLLVGHGQCVEHRGVGEPYLPVLEALGRLCRQPGGERVVQALARRAPTWLAQMPWLVGDEELEAIKLRLAGATRERMLRELLEALDELSRTATVALVLEDLHWSDPSTIDLLDAFARRREPARLFVLGTFRRGDALAQPQSVYELEQSLRVRGLCAEVAVGALSEEALDAYLALRFAPTPAPAGLARLLRERTGGKPLFARMLLDSWFEQGLVGRGDSSAGGADLGLLSADIPDTVRELIEQLQRQVDPDDARLLGAASVVGKGFSAAAVGAALERTEEDVEARCEALARTGRFLELAGEEAWPDGTVAARYEFGHDLQREVLYDLLPAGQRTRMHARVGARLEQAYHGDEGAAALLAWHFVRARDAVKAITYLTRAAEQALRRNAHHEAVGHLSEALELLDGLTAGRERDRRELALLTTLGTTQITLRGYTDPAVKETYARARELSTRLGDRAYLLPVLYGLWSDAMAGARHSEGLAIGEDFLRIADELGDPGALVARRAVAFELFFLGRFTAARGHLEDALGAYPLEERHQALLDLYGEDPRVAGCMTLAWQLSFLGHPDQALQQSVQALETARGLDHPLSLVYALTCSAILHQLRNDAVMSRALAEQALALAEEYDMALFGIWATIPLHWAESIESPGRIDEACEGIRASIETLRSAGAVVVQPYFLALLSEVEARAGRIDDALETVDRALEIAIATDELFYEAELHRLRGEYTLRRDPADEYDAEASFERALEIARQQEARALELRAALSLGKLSRSQGRASEAIAAVAELYESFEEGLETHDLLAAYSFIEQSPAPL